jgi:hypothetical protein
MINQQMDPIEQAATGQTPFSNDNSPIIKVTISDEHAHPVEQLNSHLSGSTESTTDKLKTLSDLISDHIPESKREEMMRLVFEKITSSEVEKADVDKAGGLSI